MYERSFGTDWSTLDRESAIERAFALGVAKACGESHPDEYTRVRQALPGAYDQSIVELAYEEGRTKALTLEQQGEEDVWEALVDEETKTAADSPLPEAMPGALDSREFLSRSTGPPESLNRPEFLRK
ncbi:hypothetical protein [Haloparvum sp. PAK95]|uniref:hypothetical protein n=1 Tax=Haloparvum sp. PAK95 TaxID=3418962 RepID=UPI003D2F096B